MAQVVVHCLRPQGWRGHIPGDGRYGIRPIYVEDMAQLFVDAVDQKANTVLDAVGPETFSFEELVRLIAVQVGRPVRLFTC